MRQLSQLEGLTLIEAIRSRLVWYSGDGMMLPNGVGADLILASRKHDQYLACMYFFEQAGNNVRIWGFKIFHFGRSDLDLMSHTLGEP